MLCNRWGKSQKNFKNTNKPEDMRGNDFETETDQCLVDIYQGFGWILAVFAPKNYTHSQSLKRLGLVVSKLERQRQRIKINLDNYFLSKKLNEVKMAIDNYLETYSRSLETVYLTRRFLGKYLKNKIQIIAEHLLEKKAEIIFEKTCNLLETGVIKTPFKNLDW